MPCGPAGFLMKTNLLAPYIDVFRAPLVNGHLLSMHSLVLAIFLSVVKVIEVKKKLKINTIKIHILKVKINEFLIAIEHH